MNKRSSRSRTISRITDESRKWYTKSKNSETENDSNDKNSRYKEKPGEEDG